MAGPLAGIRVLDLSRVLAGPWCTQTLADLGAEIIKIERPGAGDDTRYWGPPWLKNAKGEETAEAAYYLGANRGKHSVTIDIGKVEGQELIRELAAQCDVLVENFKTGGLAKKGLSYADLKAINPRLIYCSITGFGQTGPMAEEAGYDYLIQARGGLMSVTGEADGEPGAGPQRVGLAVSDLTTGMYSTIAILAAIRHRDQTGQGQYIDMALLDVQVSWLANQAQNYFTSGNTPTRTGAYHPNLTPYQPFSTSDGQLILAIGNDSQFQRFCKEAGLGKLAQDDKFSTNPQRVAHRIELCDCISDVMRTRTSREWTDAFRRIDVPCGPIQNISQVFEDPQVLHRGMKIETNHPEHGPVTGVANPIKYSETTIEYGKAPPTLGQDTEEVLARLLNKNEIDLQALRRNGVL
ncbi:MAG: CaiB/BaiF CoA-transferase family protein [Pseudomonadota bacterium]